MNKVLPMIAAATLAMSLAAGGAHAANLISNGTFAAGLTDWTETDSCCYFTDANGFHEGAINTNGMLSQTFSDPAGEVLTVSFDYLGEDSSSYQYVSFDGVIVPSSEVDGVSPYTAYSFTLGTGTGLDTITFNGRNNPDYNTLDNVVVTASGVPEPAAWAMMIVGMGLVGSAMRRRKVALAA